MSEGEKVSMELSRPSAVFLRATVEALNQRKLLPEGNLEALQTSAWLEEIEAAARTALETNLGGRLNVGPANRATGDVSNGERQASSLKCPDDGTCHHGCAEHYNGACWRVFNAEPLSVAGWGEKWPPRIKAAMQSRLTSLTGERHISVEDVL